MTGISVRVLEAEDDRAGFTSGNADLDRFSRSHAGQNQFRHHLGATYVAVGPGPLLGFVTLAACTVEIDHLPAATRKGLPRYPLPALRIARLAVATDARGLGVGRLLLRFALQMARDMAGRVGCVGVLVDAKPEAVTYYARFGFEPFDVLEGGSGTRPRPQVMFLPLGAIPDVAS